ncbi:MAG: CPBP family intramembrane metalloprotease [Ignavibacteria bacterium]|nr:CPBP family intramembrane metalloprotease [Ignavibacteria bacterium]
MMPNTLGRYMPNFSPSQWYMRIGRWLVYCAPMVVLIILVAPLITETPGDEWNDENLMLSNIRAIVAQSLLYVAFAVATIIEAARLPGGSSVASGLLTSRQTPHHTGIGALVATGMITITALATLAAGAQVHMVEFSIQPIFLMGLIISSMGEEVLFRGTVLQALQQRFGTYAAVVITSALFASVHLGNPYVEPLAIASTFAVGLLLGMMTVLTSSLWMSMTFHVVWNVLSSALFGEVSGLPPVVQILDIDTTSIPLPSWMFGGNYGIESGVITLALTLLALWFIPKYCKLDPFTRAARYRIDIWHPKHNERSTSASTMS